jgi:hypothetical protein
MVNVNATSPKDLSITRLTGDANASHKPIMYSPHVSKRSSVPHVNKYSEIVINAFNQILISQVQESLE